MSSTSGIPPNSLVAITAISGYIGSYCGLMALRAGYRVRGTVRSLERGRTIKEAYIKAGIQDIDNSLEIVVLDDLDSVEQYRAAFEGADGVIHTALSWDKFGQLEFLDPPVKITKSMFRAAKLVPSVKRIVYTSSVVATIRQGTFRDKVITSEDWNEESSTSVAEDAAAGRAPNPWAIYAAAKTQSEKAAWEFMEREKPDFDLVCVLPGTFSGPVLHGDPSSSAMFMAGLFKDDTAGPKSGPLNWHVDVRDCARIYIESLRTPSLGGKRIVAVNEPHGWNQILAILRKNFPNVKTIASDFEPNVGDTWAQEIDNRPAKELIGEFIGVEQSIVDLGKSLGY